MSTEYAIGQLEEIIRWLNKDIEFYDDNKTADRKGTKRGERKKRIAELNHCIAILSGEVSPEFIEKWGKKLGHTYSGHFYDKNVQVAKLIADYIGGKNEA